MTLSLYERVASYLRSAPTPSVPIARIHGALIAEVGPSVGSYGYLRAELARRSDLFVILEPRAPFGEGPTWAGPARSEYEAAIAKTGATSGARVALVAARSPAPPDPRRARAFPSHTQGGPEPLLFHHLDASLIELWRNGRDDPTLRADLADAMTQTEELRRAMSVEG